MLVTSLEIKKLKVEKGLPKVTIPMNSFISHLLNFIFEKNDFVKNIKTIFQRK